MLHLSTFPNLVSLTIWTKICLAKYSITWMTQIWQQLKHQKCFLMVFCHSIWSCYSISESICTWIYDWYVAQLHRWQTLWKFSITTYHYSLTTNPIGLCQLTHPASDSLSCCILFIYYILLLGFASSLHSCYCIENLHVRCTSHWLENRQKFLKYYRWTWTTKSFPLQPLILPASYVRSSAPYLAFSQNSSLYQPSVLMLPYLWLRPHHGVPLLHLPNRSNSTDQNLGDRYITYPLANH